MELKNRQSSLVHFRKAEPGQEMAVCYIRYVRRKVYIIEMEVFVWRRRNPLLLFAVVVVLAGVGNYYAVLPQFPFIIRLETNPFYYEMRCTKDVPVQNGFKRTKLSHP